ncbi:Hypothetical protein SMAX5B_022705 [Scophthalmus maximus]|uniref:Uncharacterized protein n=1 Tax=Scophthalmus maximus TaxID=52904 RepID=A0A2U9AWD2_SCOMX|nr:Hypothetical protein SMAX5B_022705 [Scophthalmus maximus]
MSPPPSPAIKIRRFSPRSIVQTLRHSGGRRMERRKSQVHIFNKRARSISTDKKCVGLSGCRVAPLFTNGALAVSAAGSGLWLHRLLGTAAFGSCRL